ncbi:MAG: hypothetical protein ACK5LK_11405 [Chthoniobacterales bacterium]
MSVFPVLKNPPAAEAILDVQGIFPKGVELEKLARLTEVFKESYPTRTEERSFQFDFTVIP